MDEWRTKLVIGIDPGVSGGIAWCETGKPREVAFGAQKMPDSPPAVAGLLRSLVEGTEFDAVYTFIEDVHSSPQMGVSSAFTFGKGLGVLQGACAALHLSVTPVSPQRWQKTLQLIEAGRKFGKGTTEKKRALKAAAVGLFPWLSITNHVADALLICEYGLRIHGGAALEEERF